MPVLYLRRTGNNFAIILSRIKVVRVKVQARPLMVMPVGKQSLISWSVRTGSVVPLCTLN